jgi:diphosphomevalonate decarboxylase
MQAVAQAQPNIALIKYWGKRDVDKNLPAVDSLSVTLDSLWTRMSLEFDGQLQQDVLEVNAVAAPAMLQRVSHCLDLVAGTDRAFARVASTSNFPIGAGLASSASAFAALVVAADEAVGSHHGINALARLAGAASGSAARSLFAGFVELTAGDAQIEVRSILDCASWPLEIIVAVTAEEPKPVGSTEAMIRSARTSPFYSSWLEQQAADLETARDAVQQQDFAKLAAVAEHNCLKMHSVMWGSRPPVVYWNQATIACMETIRALQAAGHGVFFTIDAGPQLKAVCLPESGGIVRDALDQTSGVLKTLASGLGQGARLLEQT